MAAGGHFGNVTLKQIDMESCVIPLFLLILAWRIHFWPRFGILTSPTIKIQDGRLRPYWKCNLKVNGHKNPCNITFPTKCGIESPFLASFLYFDESKHQNSRWQPSTNFIFSALSHITILLTEFHTRNSFSAICVYFQVSFFVFWRAQTPKFKMVIDGHQWSYWKCTSKENGPRNWCNTTLPIKCFTQNPFLKSFCILTSLNVEIQDGRPLPFPLFSDLSHPNHCSCWISHHKLKQYLLILYGALAHISTRITKT